MQVQNYNLIRRQVEDRKTFSALRSLKSVPNFNSAMTRFLHKEIAMEAKAAARSLDEGNPSDMTREELTNFQFSRSTITFSSVFFFLPSFLSSLSSSLATMKRS